MKLSPRDAAGLSIGIELVVSVMVALGAGYWLDKRLGTSPIFTLVGIVLGFAAGLRSLVAAMKRAQRRAEQEDARDAASNNNDPPSTPPDAGGT